MVRELRGGRELLRNGVAGEVNMGVFGIKKFRRIGYSAKFLSNPLQIQDYFFV